MNFLKINKILLAVFLLLSCFFYIKGVQAYSADHLILQDLDTVNNLATVCQDGGSLCSDVEVVSFDDLDSDQKDQINEMLASSAMDGYSYNSTFELDEFSNFLSHSDKISYSSDSSETYSVGFGRFHLAIIYGSTAVFLPSLLLSMGTGPQVPFFEFISNVSLVALATATWSFIIIPISLVLSGQFNSSNSK